MRLEFSHITDPPDMVADAIGLFVAPIYFLAADLFAHLDGFQHRAVAVTAPTDVIDFARSRTANKFYERIHEIGAVDIIADLFSFVTKDPVRSAGHGTNHQVR